MEIAEQATAVAVVFVLLGALAAVAAFKGRLGRFTLRAGKEGKDLVEVDRLRLSPQHTIHLVRAQDKLLLVATHPRGATIEGLHSFHSELKGVLEGQ